jgi:hypothetical protein
MRKKGQGKSGLLQQASVCLQGRSLCEREGSHVPA